MRRFAQPEAEVRDGARTCAGTGRDVVFGFTARHQAANAAAALTAAEALGVEPPQEPVEVAFSRWRSQETELPGGGLLINDAWNANPVAMRAALAHLSSARTAGAPSRCSARWPSSGRRRRATTSEIGREAEAVDVVLGVGELARRYGPDEWVADGRRGASSVALGLVRPGDAILVKGSRSVGLEVVADALLEPRP